MESLLSKDGDKNREVINNIERVIDREMKGIKANRYHVEDVNKNVNNHIFI
jgi:hypothetical protein